MKEKIWMSSPHLGGNELKYIHSAFEGNWIAPLGPNVDGFENDLKTYLGTKEVAALSAGTAAIHLSLVLLGVQAGDEVLASSFTFSATVNPITYIGAKPVLIDSEKDTWNMSPELLETAIKDRLSNGIKPKAIIVVHLYGMPAKIDQIASIANRYDIPLIEDAAEALGSRFKGKPLGTFGKLGILSFNGNKIITTSGGGALVSEDAELISKARFLSTQARDTAPHYQHSHIGFNYRMSNIVAGIGRGQMEVLDLRVAQRRANHQFYEGFFKQIESVELFSEPSADYFSNYWLTTIVIYPEKAGTNRETLRLAFEQENIETRPLWKPMHMQPIFHHCLSYTDGTAEHLFENGLCLPSSSNLTDESKARILKVLNQVFTKH